ncbi:MAG: hypothetical protein KC996_03575 [Phycisphaerales bacterium]|nr:hypothetical protein [Phycisphaerales bacterium]
MDVLQGGSGRESQALRGDLEYLLKQLRSEFAAFQHDATIFRNELHLKDPKGVFIKRFDAYMDQTQQAYLELSRQLRSAERAGGPEGQMLRARQDLRDLAERQNIGERAFVPADGYKPLLPRRQRAISHDPISSVPIFDYPWEFAADGDELIGQIFSGLGTDDGVLSDPVSPPENADTESAVGISFAETDEDAVYALANTELGGDPVKIFEYVRNTIVYEPYFGSVKGAGRTLIEGSGNDLDQACLLAAMLRSAGIPSRLSFGAIEIEIDDAAGWLGVAEPDLMLEVLQRGGIPAELQYEHNEAVAIRLDHAWVMAYVDLEPFRGARTGQSQEPGDTWLDLDPSFKQHEFVSHDLQQALSLSPSSIRVNSQIGATVLSVDSNTGVGSVDNLNEALLFEDMLASAEPVRSYLAREGIEAESVFWHKEITDQRFGLFPITDEYRVVSHGVASQHIPEVLTHKIQMVVYDALGQRIEGFGLGDGVRPVPMHSVLGESVVLGYQADDDSKAILLNPPTGFDSYAATILRVSPELYVGRENAPVVAGGVQFKPGDQHVVELRFFEPGTTEASAGLGDAEIYRHTIHAGGMHAFVLQAQSVSTQELLNLRNTLNEIDFPSYDDGNGVGDFRGSVLSFGGVLDGIGRTYFHQADRFNQMTAGATGVYATRLPSMAMVSWDVLKSAPNAADLDIGAVRLDIVRDLHAVVPRSSVEPGDGLNPASRYLLASSILANTIEIAAIKHGLFASSGASANTAIRIGNEAAGASIATVDPMISSASLEDLFASAGALEATPAILEAYIQDYAGNGVETLVLDQEVTIVDGGGDQDFIGVYLYEPQTGNNAIRLFNTDTNGFSAASVDPSAILDSAGTGVHEIPGYKNLMMFDPGDLQAHEDSLESIKSALEVLDGATASTALWYLPAVTIANDWLERRDETDPVTIPLTTLLLSQPLDRFTSEPSLLDIVVGVGSSSNPGWIAHHEYAGAASSLLSFSGHAIRSDHIDIIISDSSGDPIPEAGVSEDIVSSDPVFEFGGGSFNIGFMEQSWVDGLEDGIFSYRVVATDGSNDSVPVEGTFRVDRTPPALTINDPSMTGPGAFQIVGSAYDLESFDRLEITVSDPAGTAVYSKVISTPRVTESILANIDTTGTGFETGLTYTVNASAWDSAGNKIDSPTKTWTVVNPPDPDDISLAITGFGAQYENPSQVWTALSGQIISGAPLRVGFQADATWTSFQTQVWFETIEIMLDGEVLQVIDLNDDEWSDYHRLDALDFSFTGNPIDLLATSDYFGSGDTHTLSARVADNFSHTMVSTGVSFSVEAAAIEQFMVSPTTLTPENPVTTISAVVNDIDSSGSGSERWYIGVYTGSENSWELLDAPREAFLNTDYWINLGSGGDPPFVPGGEHGNEGSTSFSIEFDASRIFVDDSETYWIRLLTGYNSAYSGASAYQELDIDFVNRPRAVITNLENTGDVSTAQDIEHTTATAVEDGFFDLYGYAYDDDATQENVEYRVEFRRANEALIYSDNFDQNLTDVFWNPSWYAMPPDDPETGMWTVRSLVGSETHANAGWRLFEDNDQLRPGEGPKLLARLDLTGLADDEYEVALVVRSNGSDAAVDLGRLALSSPTKVGRFTFSQEDISLPTIGFPMALVRTYDSLKRDQDGPFGLGWGLGIFDLDVKVHEVRTTVESLYGTGNSGGHDDVVIRNSAIMDRSVSLTLPTGERVTFPFYLKSLGLQGHLYAQYYPPPGHPEMTLTAGFSGEPNEFYINTLLSQLTWNGDAYNAPEQHHDIPGWILTTDEGIVYTIRRVELDPDGFSINVGSAQPIEVGTVWGKPYVSRIELPTGERIDIDVDAEGNITGFEIFDAEGGASTDMIRFVYSDSEPARIIAAFGPGTDWDQPLYVYEYDTNGQLTRVARVHDVDPGLQNTDPDHQWDIDDDLYSTNPIHAEPDITSFAYDSSIPGLIVGITDPRGLQPATSEYDDAGRLIATVDQYGRRVEITRDVENRTEIVTDYGSDPATWTKYSYDEQGNVLREEHSSGKVVTRSYDDENRLLTEHDSGRNNPTEYYYGYEDGWEVTRVTDPLGNVTETSRDITYQGIPVSIITTQQLVGQDPIRTEQRFDSSGNLRETVSGTTRVGNDYDGQNRLTATLMPKIDTSGVATDELIVRTRYAYSETNPALLETVEQLNDSEEVTSYQGFAYDDLGRQWVSYTVTDDEDENPHAIIDIQEYDAVGRVKGTYRKDILNPTLPIDFDNLSDWGVQLTTTIYNSIDQVIASIDHVNETTTTTLYDLRGNVIETAVWPLDVTSVTDYGDFLDWLKAPPVVSSAVDDPPTVVDNFVTSGQAGPIVTRTAYNGRGQAQYTTEPFYILSSDYQDSSFTDVQLSLTVYDSNGYAVERHKAIGTLSLTAPTNDLFTMQASITGSSELVSTTEYDNLGRVYATKSYGEVDTAETSGHVRTEYVYDENDRQRQVIVIGMGEGGSDLVTEYEYDEAGRQIAVTGPDGNRVEYAYDSEGRRTHTFYDDPLHGQVNAETVYDPRGRRIAEIDQEGNVRAFKYDHEDRLTGVQLLSDTGSLDYGYTYDDRGNLTGIEDPNEVDTTFVYDHLGRRVSRTLPGTTRTEYWTYSDAATGQEPDSGYGKLRCHQDFEGIVAYYSYDALGRVETRAFYSGFTGDLGAFDPATDGTLEREYIYTYDEYGRVVELDRGDGSSTDRSTAWNYDEYGRVSKLYQPEGILVYEYYGVSGRLKRIKSFDGNALSNPYTENWAADGITTNEFVYDTLGRLAEVRYYTGASYSSSTDPTWTYEYTALGARKSLAYTEGSDAHVTLYDYDTLGRLTKIENWGGTASSPTDLISAYHYTHRADGRRASVREIRDEGSGNHSGMLVEYAYDAYGRLVEEVSGKDETSPDFINGSLSISWVDHPDLDERNFTRTYAYDEAGNRLSRTTDYATITDEFVEYFYAGNGDEMTGLNKWAGLDNSGTLAGSEAYSYDDNGFMTLKEVSTDSTTDIEWRHEYTPDIEARLGAYSRFDIDNSNTESAFAYDYNESGVRVKAGGRYFLVDSLNPTGYAQVLVERSGGEQSATLAKRYAVGDDMLAQQVGSAMQSLLMDGHGSTRQLYSGSIATMERYDYDAFGEAFRYELDDPGSVVSRPQTDLLYAGEQWDADLGMQYLRARYYMPGQGVFNRLDPFFGNTDDPQSLHKYAYTHNDPVNGIDPSGMISQIQLLSTIAIAGGLVSTAFYIGNQYSTGQPITIGGLLLSFAVGFVLGPLAFLFPPVAAVLGIVGVSLQAYASYQVIANPDSTWGQRAVAVFLLFGAGFGAAKGVQHFKSNGWTNLTSLRPATVPIPREARLGEILPRSLSDDAMFHLTKPEFQTPIYEGGARSNTWWFRYGDIKNMTLQQLRGTVGSLANGGTKEARIMIVVPEPQRGVFRARGPASGTGIIEYQNVTPVKSDNFFMLGTVESTPGAP